MSSRDRILAALAHREPDRPPVDLSGHRSSGITAVAYARLRRHLGLPERPFRVYAPLQQLAIVDEDVLDLFQVDTIELGRAFAREDSDRQDWVLPRGTPCQIPPWINLRREPGRWVMLSASGRELAQMPDGVLYFEQTYWPLVEADDLDHLPNHLSESMWTAVATPPGPLVAGPDGPTRLRRAPSDCAWQPTGPLSGYLGGNLLELGQFLYRNDNFYLLLASEPRRCTPFLDCAVEMHLANLERFLGAVGPFIGFILFGDDLGMQ